MTACFAAMAIHVKDISALTPLSCEIFEYHRHNR